VSKELLIVLQGMVTTDEGSSRRVLESIDARIPKGWEPPSSLPEFYTDQQTTVTSMVSQGSPSVHYATIRLSVPLLSKVTKTPCHAQECAVNQAGIYHPHVH
jgi:hypothetical protein